MRLHDQPSGPVATGTARRLTGGAAVAPVVTPLIVDEARWLAARLLCGSGTRWEHARAVASRAALAAAVLDPDERPLLIAAAWVHDIGYARTVRRTGFHPLDGALYLHDRGWPSTIVGLVAHHSGARFVAEVWGVGQLMRTFDADEYAYGPLADALTYADQTTGPDGELMTIDDRLADMLRRHGPDSPNARAHALRAPALRAAVHRTERRLQRIALEPTAHEQAQ